MKKAAILLLLLGMTGTIHAQSFTDRLSISAEGDYLITSGHMARYVPGTTNFPAHDIELGISTLPSDRNPFAEAMNFPVFSLGFGHTSLGDIQFLEVHSKASDMFHVYVAMDREIIRRGSYSFGYEAMLGLTYTDTVYDIIDNPMSKIFSSHYSIYAGGGLHFKWRPFESYRRLELEADAVFRHSSCGRLSYPNSGYNGYGAGLTVRHYFSDEAIAKPGSKRRNIPDSEYPEENGMHYHIVAGGGYHSCSAEWLAFRAMERKEEDKRQELSKWPRASIALETTYRYAGRFSSGISAEFFYCGETEMLKEADIRISGDDAEGNKGYSPYSGGIGLVHECFYGPLAVYLNAGVYVYRRMGIRANHGPVWLRAGLRYYPKAIRPLFFGVSCKAQAMKAEYMDFTIGIDIR